jgi:hypothetical protein
MNVYAILAVVAVAILAIAEVLTTIQKAQMKKQFLEDLDRQAKQSPDDSDRKQI